MRFAVYSLLFAFVVLPVSAQKITLTLTSGGSYFSPATFEPANPINVGSVAVTSGTANVTLAFSGTVAKLVASSQINNTCQNNGTSSLTIPVSTTPTQLYACFWNLGTGGKFYFLMTASAPKLATVTGALPVSSNPGGSLTVTQTQTPLDISQQAQQATVSTSAAQGLSQQHQITYAPASSPTWLSESDPCGTIAGSHDYSHSCTATFSVASSSGLTPGNQYMADVRFSDANGSVGDAIITYTPAPVVVSPATVSAQPNGLSFRPQFTGIQGPVQAVTLTNTSSTSVTVNGISFSGPDASDFVQTNNCPATLTANTSCTISVSSMPISTGARNATLSISDSATGSPQTVTLNGTGIAGANAFAVYRPSNGTWFVLNRNATSQYPVPSIQQQWGIPGDIPVPGDYDGDGYSDFAVWRPSNGTWYVLYRNATSTYPAPSVAQQWGLPGDIPVPGDYDGDGKTDFAVYRPSNGIWFIIPSSNPNAPIIQQWGLTGDVPVIGDFNNDGQADFAVYRPSNGIWYVLYSSATAQYPVPSIAQQWGLPGDVPVSGDFNNDGRTDFAVWRPSNGSWYVLYSSATAQYPVPSFAQQWGLPNDTPMMGDFNADGQTDFNVWRPSNGTWFSLYSTATSQYPAASLAQQWGLPSDVPLIFR